MKSMVRTRSREMPLQVVCEQRCRGRLHQVGHQFAPLVGVVLERKCFRVRCQEKVEGIQNRHFGDQSHLDLQFACLVREHQPRQIVALRVLLPIDEVIGGANLQ